MSNPKKQIKNELKFISNQLKHINYTTYQNSKEYMEHILKTDNTINMSIAALNYIKTLTFELPLHGCAGIKQQLKELEKICNNYLSEENR